MFFLPRAVSWRIVRLCRDEMRHFGVEKTFLRKYITAYISACHNKVKGEKQEGRLHAKEILPIPFRVLHIDHL